MIAEPEDNRSIGVSFYYLKQEQKCSIVYMLAVFVLRNGETINWQEQY